MRPFGWILIVGGVVFGLYALNMDVSVSTGVTGFGLPDRVNNLGLMQDRQNYLIVSGFAVVIGAVLAAFGGGSKAKGAADPFDQVEIDREHKFKQYAVDLGVRRKDGLYIYDGASYDRLSAAVAVAEHRQGIKTNTEFAAIRRASAEAAEIDAAAASVNKIAAVMSLTVLVIVVLIGNFLIR